jgi:tRNA nucleotidyltransferase/poly(A) polymerase
MLFDPEANADGTLGLSGQVIDWVGGLDDIEARMLRAIGVPGQRFEEDALRMLRAVRFTSRFGLSIEPETAAAIQRLARRLELVSSERVRNELAGALSLSAASDVVALLGDMGLADVLFPEVVATDPGLAAGRLRMSALCDVLRSNVPSGSRDGGFEAATELDLPLALASLLFDIQPQTSAERMELGRRLKLSNVESRQLDQIWSLHQSLLEQIDDIGAQALVSDKARQGQQRPALVRFLRSPLADHALCLALANASLGDGDALASALLSLRLLRAGAARARWSPKPWVTGETLTSLGYQPGVRFGPALLAAEDVQICGGNQKEALIAARCLLDQPR